MTIEEVIELKDGDKVWCGACGCEGAVGMILHMENSGYGQGYTFCTFQPDDKDLPILVFYAIKYEEFVAG